MTESSNKCDSSVSFLYPEVEPGCKWPSVSNEMDKRNVVGGGGVCSLLGSS